METRTHTQKPVRTPATHIKVVYPETTSGKERKDRKGVEVLVVETVKDINITILIRQRKSTNRKKLTRVREPHLSASAPTSYRESDLLSPVI